MNYCRVLSPSRSKSGPQAQHIYDSGAATLLPLRSKGPPTDVSDALRRLREFQCEQDCMLPRPHPRPLELRDAPPHGERHTYEVPQPAMLADRRVLYGRGVLGEAASVSTTNTTTNTSISSIHSTAAIAKARRTVPLTAQKASQRRLTKGGGMNEVGGHVTAAERVRYRSSVTRKVMDLFDEANELYESRQNMREQVHAAMRADPRHSVEKLGDVRLSKAPQTEQEDALNAVVEALCVLRESAVELVAAYLTPEEKRFMGVDPQFFQTRRERATHYQYAPDPAPGRAGRKSARPAASSPNSSNSSTASVPKCASASMSTERKISTKNNEASFTVMPTAHIVLPVDAVSELPAVPQPAGEAEVVEVAVPVLPALQAQQSPAAPPAAVSSRWQAMMVQDTSEEEEGSNAARTPERQFAPVMSSSSLGGDTVGTEGLSPGNRPAPAPVAVNAATINVPLVSSLPHASSSAHSSVMHAAPPPPPVSLPQGAPATTRPSAFGNTAASGGIAPAAPKYRSEFQKFLIDSSSDTSVL